MEKNKKLLVSLLLSFSAIFGITYLMSSENGVKNVIFSGRKDKKNKRYGGGGAGDTGNG